MFVYCAILCVLEYLWEAFSPCRGLFSLCGGLLWACPPPILKKAKQSPNYQKVYLKRDVLVIDDVEYFFDENLHELPPDLHPKMFSYKSNDQ